MNIGRWLIPTAVALAAISVDQARGREYPPLTDDQRTALDAARDGRDYQEEAFFALLVNAAAYDGDVGDAPVRMDPDVGAMAERPEDFRGDLCRLEGVLQQRTELTGPFVGAVECFLRDDAGTPFIVYIARMGETRQPLSAFHDGQRVVVFARFYKRMDLEARDGMRRSYAAFVGARPQLVIPGGSDLTGLWIVAGPVVVLFGVFLVLFLYARRHTGSPPNRARRAADVRDEVDESEPLPDDPVEALGELRHRAEASAAVPPDRPE